MRLVPNRRRGQGLLGLLVLGASLGAGVAPADLLQAKVDALLAPFATRSALTAFLGPEPNTCVAAQSDYELCEWLLGNRDPGWAPTSDAIATRSRVGVLCVLPLDDAPRANGSCTLHERRSNRDRYRVGKGTTRSASARNARARGLEERRDEAQQDLDGARTLVELSRLLGTAPSVCHDTGGGLQLCTWRLNAHTRGHGTVAASIRVDLSKKVRLRCNVPVDGSERAEGSCAAQIGS